MKESFISKRFNANSIVQIDLANGILSEYRKMGYVLTLRQLFYQMVARDYIENSMKSYKRFGGLISDARLAGLIDWAMIEDRARVTQFPPHWNDPAEIVEAAAKQFAIDKWLFQDWYIEVMCEKDALSGVLAPVCKRLDVAFTANRGYSSSSAMYEAGKRIAKRMREGKSVLIIYLGDHDPSGMDMTRDIRERLEMFSGYYDDEYNALKIDRIALNMDQIEEFDPPENPAKLTDSRASSYIAEFGKSSWELDAVEPSELDRLVTERVEQWRDDEQWEIDVARENEMKAQLQKFVKEYRAK